MFELTKKQSSNKTLRLPDDLIATLDKMAVDMDISFTKVVIQCCEYAIANMKKPEEKA